MPVEIRELQINVTVNEQKASSAAPNGSDAQVGGNQDDQKNLINQCLDQVLEILENKKER